jgi:transaldolase
MAPGDFASFGASVKTLRQFIGGYEKLLHYVRDAMLPPP